MKLSGAKAAGFLRKPDPAVGGILLFGEDAARIALVRRDLVATLIGPQGEAEMRLTRLSGADLRKDPAEVQDAVRATGFFPGPRAVLVEEATDGTAPALRTVLADWRRGDASLVVAAGALKPASALRKAFEASKVAAAIGIYDDPPPAEEIARLVSEAGLTADRNGMSALVALSRSVEPGDFRQAIEKLALLKWPDGGTVTPEDIAALSPALSGAESDAIFDAAAEGQLDQIGPLARRLAAQGVTPVSLAIGAGRHFRLLHVLATDPGGPAQSVARLRPPVPWQRKDRVLRQVRHWSVPRLEAAIAIIHETDLVLRSSPRVPAAAVIERALLKVATLKRD